MKQQDFFEVDEEIKSRTANLVTSQLRLAEPASSSSVAKANPNGGPAPEKDTKPAGVGILGNRGRTQDTGPFAAALRLFNDNLEYTFLIFLSF